MSNSLTRIHADIRLRMAELEPAVRESARLHLALAELDRQRDSPPGSSVIDSHGRADPSADDEAERG